MNGVAWKADSAPIYTIFEANIMHTCICDQCASMSTNTSLRVCKWVAYTTNTEMDGVRTSETDTPTKYVAKWRNTNLNYIRICWLSEKDPHKNRSMKRTHRTNESNETLITFFSSLLCSRNFWELIIIRTKWNCFGRESK